MSQRSSAANGPGRANWPQAPGRSDWADDGEWPDDLWPDDDDGPPGGPGGPADSGPAAPAPVTSPGWAAGGPAGPPKPRPRLITLVLIALAAAAVGAGIVLAVRDLSRPAAAVAPGSQPSYAIGGQPGGNAQPGANGALPGGGGGGGGRLFVIGKVTAVSRTSITIGGSGHSVTAAVTNSTRITGKVSGIGGIKTGDEVSAQITQSGGKASATAIQDPAQAPAGGNLP